MSGDLKIDEKEYAKALKTLQLQCRELEDILSEYSVLMSKVGYSGLDSQRVRERLQGQTQLVGNLKDELSSICEMLIGSVDSFTQAIETVDRY